MSRITRNELFAAAALGLGILTVAGARSVAAQEDAFALEPVPVGGGRGSAQPSSGSRLKAVAVTSRWVALGWTEGAPVSGYRVFRRTGLTGAWCMLGSADSEATEFHDPTVNGSTTYMYFVEAVYDSISALAMAPVMVTTPPESAVDVQRSQWEEPGSFDDAAHPASHLRIPSVFCSLEIPENIETFDPVPDGDGYEQNRVIPWMDRVQTDIPVLEWLLDLEAQLLGTESWHPERFPVAHPSVQ